MVQGSSSTQIPLPPPGFAAFEISSISVPDNLELLLAQAAALGPSLGMGNGMRWLAIGIGRFDTPIASLRFALAAENDKAASLNAEILRGVLANNAAEIRFRDLQTKEEPRKEDLGWLSLDNSLDLEGHIPRLRPTSSRANVLWTGRFLSGLYNLGSQRAGVILLLRPFSETREQDGSALTSLRRFFDTEPILSTQQQFSATDRSYRTGSPKSEQPPFHDAVGHFRALKVSEPSKDTVFKTTKGPEYEKIETSTWVHQLQDSDGERRRQRGLTMLQELARSGAFWLRIRVFGTTLAEARRVASLFWSCVANVGRGAEESWDYPRVLRLSDKKSLDSGSSRHRASASACTVWPFQVLPSIELPVLEYGQSTESDRKAEAGRPTDQPPRSETTRKTATEPTAAPEGKAEPKRNAKTDDATWLYLVLARHGIDLAFWRVGRTEPYESAEAELTAQSGWAGRALQDCKGLVLPGVADMLVSGERLSTVFQLPVDPNPAIYVARGFGFCHPPIQHALKDEDTVTIGVHSPGGLQEAAENPSSPPRHALKLPIDSLTMHTLVVGSTGSGKTTTVASLLLGLAETRGVNIRFCILEGAKREYRAYQDLLKLKRYDLRSDTGFLKINIFEHPDSFSPETHISQLAALFESTLAMPPPIPIIIREALQQAYDEYHACDSPVLRGMHPIRFWLTKAVLSVAEQYSYAGETKKNIDAILKTRLRSLATGACGQILSGPPGAMGSFKESLLLELESIGDEYSRAFIMSLFVLYYRYDLSWKPSSKLTNVLVLEEAHRIIGKPAPSEGHGGGSREYFSNLLSEVRTYGCGIVISDQSPSRLIDDAMRNTNTKLIMRLVSGEDIQSTVAGAGLPKEAQGDIPKLRRGQAILVRPEQLPALANIKRDQRVKTPEPEGALPQRTLRDRQKDDANKAAWIWEFLAAAQAQPNTLKPVTALLKKLDLTPYLNELIGQIKMKHAGCDGCEKMRLLDSASGKIQNAEFLCQAHTAKIEVMALALYLQK